MGVRLPLCPLLGRMLVPGFLVHKLLERVPAGELFMTLEVHDDHRHRMAFPFSILVLQLEPPCPPQELLLIDRNYRSCRGSGIRDGLRLLR